MFRNWGKRLILIYLSLAALILVLLCTGKTRIIDNNDRSILAADTAAWSPANIQLQSDTTLVTPVPASPSVANPSPALTNKPVSKNTPQVKSRSKQLKQKQIKRSRTKSGKIFQTTRAFKGYTPKYTIALAHPNNYGERYAKDARGIPVNNQAIIVLHETASTARSAINTFRTPHTEDSKQVS